MAVIDRISARAPQVQLLPLLLSGLAVPFVLSGWVGFWIGVSVRSGLRRTAVVLRWMVAAVAVGVEMARDGRAG
ncbi:MAG: hypothetical protein V4515_14850 [Chloroflexota bacterium]